MLSMLLSRTGLRPYLSYVGKHKLPILFLHMMVGMWIYIVYHYFGREPHYLLCTALSLQIPLGFAAVVDQFAITRSLFLGKGSYELFGRLPNLFTKYVRLEKRRLQSR